MLRIGWIRWDGFEIDIKVLTVIITPDCILNTNNCILNTAKRFDFLTFVLHKK